MLLHFKRSSLLLTLVTLACVAFLALYFSSTNSSDRPQSKGPDSFQTITGNDMSEEREHWNAIFRVPEYIFGRDPDPFLKEHAHLLAGNKALVIPMSEGKNAVYLAQKGFNTFGVDISTSALEKARGLAREKHVVVTGINADLNNYEIETDSYDLIVDIDFHHPRLISQIKQGLKRGGMVLYESLTIDQEKTLKGRNFRHDRLLAHGELKRLFSDFEIIVYRETIEETRAVASLVARKR